MKANPQDNKDSTARYSNGGVVVMMICCLSLIAFFFVLRQNGSWSFYSVLPFLILLACPLMHLFMHRSHGQH